MAFLNNSKVPVSFLHMNHDDVVAHLHHKLMASIIRILAIEMDFLLIKLISSYLKFH